MLLGASSWAARAHRDPSSPSTAKDGRSRRTLTSILSISAAALFGFVILAWALSLPLRDASIADPAWPLGFVLIAWIADAVGAGSPARRLLLALLVSVWGLRLAAHLTARKLRERGEDRRYRRMRERRGGRFPLVSLPAVFLLQGALIWIISLPLQAAAPRPAGLGVLDAIGGALWAVGLVFEAVGDWQLQRFRSNQQNRTAVMDEGLWRYTRHPNYFGDACVWWGLWLVALAAGGTWWTVLAPLVMTALLVRFSGKDLLERELTERRPGYRDYVRRTSGFVPLPPRASGPRRS